MLRDHQQRRQNARTTSPKTPIEKAENKVINLFGFFDNHPEIEGGWIYNWNTDKYFCFDGEWNEETQDDNIRIPESDLETALKTLQAVYPQSRLMIVTL